MADVQNTKVAIAAKKLNLHRSSPYTVEVTSPDGTCVLECGEKIVVEQSVVGTAYYGVTEYDDLGEGIQH